MTGGGAAGAAGGRGAPSLRALSPALFSCATGSVLGFCHAVCLH